MFQIVIFLILTGLCFPITAERGSRGSRSPAEVKNRSNLKLSNQKMFAAGLIENNSFTKNKCQKELHAITSIDNQFRQQQRNLQKSPEHLLPAANRANNEVQSHLQSCTEKIKNEISGKTHPVSGEKWYDQYLAEKKYEKDFKYYPELEKQFKGKIERAYHGFKNNFLAGMQVSSRGAFHGNINLNKSVQEIIFYTSSHPHIQDPELVDNYNKALEKLRKQRTCNPEKIKSCHEDLLEQLAEDSKSGLKAYCHKALREGQVCCSNPNKSCGDFAFAKEIAKSFSRSTPMILQTFAQLRGVQGRPEEACKLSALGGVVGPLGNMQIDSCNQAIEGCREVCGSKVAKFRNNFKKCYKIQKGESIREIIKKATNEEGFEEGDPKALCKDLIAEVAEAYKEMSIDSSYSLSEESDHEEVVACRGEIGRYAPNGQQMGPAEQLAVNMCYRQIEQPTAQAVAPPSPGQAAYSPTDEISGLAGAIPRQGFPALSQVPGEEEPGAPGMDDDGDFLPAGPEKPEANNTGFMHPGGSGGGSGSGGGLGAGGGGPSGKSNGKGARALAGGKLTGGNSGDFAFQQGEGGEDAGESSWEEGDDFGPQIEKDRKKAEDLRKLRPDHLTDEEKDLLRAFTPPGQHENIFDFHSFMFHWFCRNYGCSGYFKAMGIPESMRRKIKEPKKFEKKNEVAKKT